MDNAKLTVGLVYGGKSGEHEVSLQTAFAVMNAFDYDKYEILPFYITKQGLWKIGEKLNAPFEQPEQLKLEGAPEDIGKALGAVFSGLGGEAAVDVMFPLLHGTNGEDGTIQGLFEMANIPYVGAGVLASAVGMDKIVMKKLFAEARLEQCRYGYFTTNIWKNKSHDLIVGIEDKLGYPVFVKPANLGSSVGISKAADKESLVKAIETAFRYDTKVIVEEFIEGRELEVSVLGNDEPEASAPGEIISSGEYYDYAAKYIDGKSQLLIPASVDPEIAERLREMALVAFRAIQVSGIARVDFFLRKSDGRILINEINTMPGFTPFSMYPLLWRETGLSYQALLDRMIALALERYQVKQGLKYDNEQ
ncbi:D-alanine-D-alanine ligase [Paenibacillus forsythiae]|uniref:D-alanine--D-alanine ligase n=1 Tax=Paenibacillus forsythiae TaxID=365616 RepID=A0ABU3HCF4_9BACL|nr:D-alanine--D-alanine ligase [Paenibacillus forsythiae]MDT3428498.1 D-alanine-D-alanine ligase [Paenibacillus forsythiae]